VPGAGRWEDAAEVARHIASSIPRNREHEARLELATAIAEIAAGEAGLGPGIAPAIPGTPAQSGDALDAILSRFSAAASVRQALRQVSVAQSPQRLTELADQMELAAEAIQPAEVAAPSLPTELAWATWAGVLRSVAHLLRWDAATQDASENADRHLQAARRRAEVASSNRAVDMDGDPLLQPLAKLNAQIAAVQRPGDIAAIARHVERVPLPLRVIEESGRRFPLPAAADADEQRQAPAVGVCRLDGTLVTNAHVLRPDEVHDLILEIRLTDWPEQATTLEVTFLSVLSPHQARLPGFTFPRTSPDEDGIYRLSASGALSVSFTLPAGAPPQAFPIAARFTGPDMDEAVDMQFDRAYRKGARVTERAFHDDLFNRLLSDPALEGRVERGNRTAGGFLDVVHDRINAELKVARQTAVTVETSHKYLGQPTDYAADTGSQLSILVVLDMTQKQTPPGVLENYLGWMRPAVAGLDNARYPSLVGVVIINGNLPVPSGYSRGKGGPASPVEP